MDANFRTKMRQQFSTHQLDEWKSDSEEPVAERRRGQRIEIETLVAAITKDGSRFEGYTRSISDHGTAAIVWGELNVGDEVILAYRPLGSTEETVIPAIVRSALENRYGFEFTVAQPGELQGLIVKACRTAESCSPSAVNRL